VSYIHSLIYRFAFGPLLNGLGANDPNYHHKISLGDNCPMSVSINLIQ